MIDKKSNLYKILLQEVTLKDGTQSGKNIEFEFENHDNIFHIIDKIQAKNIFDDKAHGIEFSVGLKLFSEVILKNRDNPLFEELKPAIGEFMKKLKTFNPEN